MKFRPRRTAAAVLFLALAGCDRGTTGPIRPVAHPVSGPSAKPDPWLLTCLDPTAEAPALLWNGLIGVRIGRDGAGKGPMFLIDEYDTQGEEKIRPLDNVLDGAWTAGPTSRALSPLGSRKYRQVLDMRTGLLSTSWTQSVDGMDVRVSTRTAIQPSGRRLAQTWTIDSDSYLPLGFRGPDKGKVEGVDRPDHLVRSRWPPSGAPITEKDVLGADIRKDMMLAWSCDRSVSVSAASDRGKPFTMTRFIDVGPSPNAARMPLARGGQTMPPDDFARSGELRFDDFAGAITREWAGRWETDIEIDGPVEDQQAVRSFLFYLRSAIHPNGHMSISPFGLSNGAYGGHVFWDADMWVFPVLALIDPEEAKAIPRYRLASREKAAANFRAWAETGKIPVSPGETAYRYPWESSVTGSETTPAHSASRFEEHGRGDIAWSLTLAASLGMVAPPDAASVVQGVANYYRARSIKTSAGFEMRKLLSPDENEIVDNDLYTNLLAEWCMDGGKWGAGPPKYKLPRDEHGFLTFDRDRLIRYDQADAVLAIYPLQYPPAEREARSMMERFAPKVGSHGPAMTDSVHAVIWARLGEPDRAYEAWKRSWQDFVREPFLLFCEKRNHKSDYFTTGAAGCLQSLLYGFLGFRIDSKEQDGALWSKRLALGRILSVKPNLPQSWKKVKFKNFALNGGRYTLIASHNGVQVIQGDR